MNGHRVSALLAIPPMRNVTPASQDRSPGTPTMRMNGAPKMVLCAGHPPSDSHLRSEMWGTRLSDTFGWASRCMLVAIRRESMVRPTWLCVAFAAVLWIGCSGIGVSQTDSPVPGTTQVDPLAVGKTALSRQDYASAYDFFSHFRAENPGDKVAIFLEGNAALGLGQLPEAESCYRAALALDAELWSAHENLVQVYARLSRWSEFDSERALLHQARLTHQAGIPERGTGAIDLFTGGNLRIVVHEYDPPDGPFHAKYNFAEFDAQGKLIGWISYESDDIDQISFAKNHPKEAAAGGRAYSLDSYTPKTMTAGGNITQTHGTIKLFPDGELPYPEVRADVMAALEHKIGPMSTTVHTIAPQQPTPSSKP